MYHARRRNTSRNSEVPFRRPFLLAFRNKCKGFSPIVIQTLPQRKDLKYNLSYLWIQAGTKNSGCLRSLWLAHVIPRGLGRTSRHRRARVAHLVERGWLRATDTPDTYARTEDGRLQLAGPRDVTIYSRPGCHLCEEAKTQIAPLLEEFGARLTEINIDEDAELRARYDYDVPVIFLGARKAAKHRVDLAQFRRQLRDASVRGLNRLSDQGAISSVARNGFHSNGFVGDIAHAL